MRWYKDFGYKTNPLESNPFKSKEDPIGYDDEIENLVYYVEADGAVLIEGPLGSGKTLLLSQVINNFGGKGKIIYLDGNKINKRIDFSDVLIGNQGFLRKALKKTPMGMILLIDNAISLPRKSYELLQYYFDQGYIKSVIFATDDSKKLNLPGSMLDRIGSRVIKTKVLLMDDAVEMVLDRLNQDLLSKDQLEKIFIISDKNMTEFLKNCEKVLKYMSDENLEDIDFKTITKVLNAKEDDFDEDEDEYDEEDPDTCHECGEKLVKVGVHHRCEECDLYCPACGVLIDVDDYECPSCGVMFEDEEDE